ncbi:UNVERIFIED_CONTAM: hypothetical protein Sangu_3236000, partial [Sesamum angustifolium]
AQAFQYCQNKYHGGSSYFASLARRVREAEESSDAAYLKELYHRNDPETIM